MNHFLKGALLQATLLATILFFTSCENNENQQGSKAFAKESNDETFDNNKKENEAKFLVKAAEINLKEIHLGQLAQQNGNATSVKEFAKMMEDAHTKSQQDLTALAKSKDVTIPSAPSDESNDTYTKLNEKTGNEFDKEYVDKMVSSHKDAIEVYEKAAEDSNDQDIRNWANATLPDLRKHHSHAIETQKKYNNQ